jgi:DNA-binding IclR family transcriptional regulator
MEAEANIGGIPSGRRGIQSVEIGARILEALRDSGGSMTLKEIAQATRMSASNCHRYLASWANVGFVAQDIRTGRYDLGPGIARTGLAALSRLDPIAIGSDALIKVVDETELSGLLTVWGDVGAVIVRWIVGRRAVRTMLSTGSVLPLLRSATGRVFLAYLPERQTAAAVASEAGKGCEDPALLAARTREQGIAQVSGDHIPGLSAIAVPILDPFGEAAAALTLVGLADGFEESTIEALRRAGVEASIALGWPGKRIGDVDCISR